VKLNIEGDVAAVLRDIRFGVPDDIVKPATVTALNKTNSKIGTAFKRSVASATGLKQKDFKRKIKAYRATRRSVSAKTWIGLRSKIPLSRVASGRRGAYLKGTLLDVSAADAFTATVGSGRHEGVFVRSPKAATASGRDSRGRLRRGRLPIQEVKLDLSRVAPQLLKKAGDSVGEKEFQQQFAFELKRRLRRPARKSRTSRRSR